MGSIRTWGCAALLLTALPAPAIAAPASEARSADRENAPTAMPIAPSHFDLAAGSVRRPGSARRTDPAHYPRVAKFTETKASNIEGPSWSYQTSQRGPVFEMGALGGGAIADAPFLAHVAMAWQF